MPSLILVFDFDRTILDNDSDRAIFDYFNVRQEVEDKVRTQQQQWTKVCDEIYNRFTRKQLEEAIPKTFKVQPGMIELMNEIGKKQQQQQQQHQQLQEQGNDGATIASASTFFPPNVTSVQLVLATDSNEFFIRYAFERFFPNTRIDLLHTNPTSWEGPKEHEPADAQHLRVHWCEKNGHSCHRCNTAGLPNMCKGLCIRRLLTDNFDPADDDPVVYFFGDGFNDMCAVAHLRACDTAFVRRNFALHTKCIAGAVVKTPVPSNAPCYGSFPTVVTTAPSSAASFSSSPFATTQNSGGFTTTREEILLQHAIDDENYRGVCRLVPWKDGGDLLAAVRDHVQHTLASLPPLNILAEEENTFRLYSQQVRIPRTLRDSLSSSMMSKVDAATKDEIERLASAIEKNLPVPDDLVRFGYEGSSSKPTKNKMMKAIGNLPWLHGEMAIHRYLDHTIRRRHDYRQRREEQKSSSSAVIQSVDEDFWSGHKLQAIDHALPWIVNLIVRHEQLWNVAVDGGDDGQVRSSSACSSASSLLSREFIQDQFTQLLMHQLQGNIADLCFRSSSDVGNMFEPTLVRDDREQVAKFFVDKIFGGLEHESGPMEAMTSLCDVVVDNAGPELAADLLLLASILGVASRLAKKSDQQNKDLSSFHYVRLIVKDRPFYVSDTVPHDVEVLLEKLEKYVQGADKLTGDGATKISGATTAAVVVEFIRILRKYIGLRSAATENSSSLGVRPSTRCCSHEYQKIQIIPADWTTKALEFRDLGFESTIFGFLVPPPLPPQQQQQQRDADSWTRPSYPLSYEYDDGGDHAIQYSVRDSTSSSSSSSSPLIFLPKTRLVIVKGDLNYRRLVSDRKWPVQTSFHRVLDESIFRHLPVVAIRTLKCEVLIGITKQMEEQMNESDPKKNDPVFGWRVNGQAGLIAFAEPR